MTQVILERVFDAPVSPEDFKQMARAGAECMPLYRVNWHESLLAEDGERMVCRFEAPDCESVRQVVRESEARNKVAWTGTVHDTGREGLANVLVERRFSEPVSMADLQAREDAAAWCLQLHQVTFLRTFFSLDHTRMLCLYRAPDAESVRLAQRKADMPVERVWACRNYLPEDLSSQ